MQNYFILIPLWRENNFDNSRKHLFCSCGGWNFPATTAYYASAVTSCSSVA